YCFFFFSSRRRHTRCSRDWSSDVCSSDLDRAAVDAMLGEVTADLGLPDVVMFNPSARVRGPFTELDPEAVKRALLVTCYGGYLRSEERRVGKEWRCRGAAADD